MPYKNTSEFNDKPSLREFLIFRANNWKHSNERVLEKVKVILRRLAHYYQKLPVEDQRSIAISIEHYFESDYCKNWFLENHQDDKTNLEKSAIRNFRNYTTKNVTKKHWKDLFALYSGFAGFVGYEENKTIYDCFEISEQYEHFKDDALLKYLTPPKISKREQQIVEENTYDLFYEDYAGEYNIFFIEEQYENAKGLFFGASNIIIGFHYNRLFFKHIGDDKITESSLVLMPDSTESTFFLREIRIDWGYLTGLPRPFRGVEGHEKDFLIPYLGVGETSGTPFAAMAYAMRIEEDEYFVVPDRRLEYNSVHDLRSWKKPMSSRQYNQKRKRRSVSFASTYQNIKLDSKEIDKKVQKRIQDALKTLEKIGNPLELPEKIEEKRKTK